MPSSTCARARRGTAWSWTTISDSSLEFRCAKSEWQSKSPEPALSDDSPEFRCAKSEWQSRSREPALARQEARFLPSGHCSRPPDLSVHTPARGDERCALLATPPGWSACQTCKPCWFGRASGLPARPQELG